MDNEYKNYKADRVLKLLFRALKGESLSVAALADLELHISLLPDSVKDHG
jgi:hypothetical protein